MVLDVCIVRKRIEPDAEGDTPFALLEFVVGEQKPFQRILRYCLKEPPRLACLAIELELEVDVECLSARSTDV